MNVIKEIIGYAACCTGTIMMIPQLVKAVKRRSVEDVSLGMIILYIANCTLWGVYGILIVSVPLIVVDVITFAIGCAFLWIYLRTKNVVTAPL